MRIFRIDLGGRGARSLIPIYSFHHFHLVFSLVFDSKAVMRAGFPWLPWFGCDYALECALTTQAEYGARSFTLIRLVCSFRHRFLWVLMVELEGFMHV